MSLPAARKLVQRVRRMNIEFDSDRNQHRWFVHMVAHVEFVDGRKPHSALKSVRTLDSSQRENLGFSPHSDRIVRVEI